MNFGVIGLGKITTTFVKEFEYITDSKVIIAGSRNLDKAKEFCAAHNIASYGTYDDVIQNADVEAIYIGTPHNSHFEIALKALEAGKHVLCEKSITTDAKQYKILKDIALSKNIMLMDAMWTYFLPATEKAKSWVDQGLIGQVKYINIDFAFPAAKDFEGRLYNPQLAGGALLDIGVYVIYNTFLYLGIDYQSFFTTAEFSPTGVDESLQICFDYGEAKANLYCSVTHRAISTTYIYGTLGYITLPLFWKTKSALRFDSNDTLIESFNDDRICHGFEYEIKHFITCAKSGLSESPVLSHQLTTKVMETMDEVRSKIGLVFPFD